MNVFSALLPQKFLAVATLFCASALLIVSSGCGLTAKAQNAEGVRLYQQGQFPGAQQRFQQAIHGNPRSADAYYNLAATYHQNGKASKQPGELDQAESYYHQCLDREPNHRDCYRGLAVLLVEQERSEEAFRLVEGWMTRSPSLADPRIELARLSEEFGDHKASEHYLLEALNVEPNNSRALAALGRLREESGNQAQALANYQRSLWNDRFQPEVAARVAALQTALGTSAVASAAPPPGTRAATAPAPIFR